uniref:Uncharacterized protein n=1 Tax=Candidatus Kentrum sp. FW TaxID=2126338 RepID=A0A450SFN7_9GAMM|nr:MAG: hypothetical protein BECKFW1821A_GA0114235_10186 [Candidatus Kentron sp. FW]VFJ51686.1 MAG: hypothetical protein BECKFW1821B_GA0114236_10104 [Candidatus Kentron sp. FW]
MNWQQVREQYPRKWVLAEAMEGHAESDRWRVDRLTVIDAFTEVSDALSAHKQLHGQAPERDYFVAHTDKEELAMKERYWLGIRTAI